MVNAMDYDLTLVKLIFDFRCTHLDFVDVKPRCQGLQCQANLLNLCWASSNKIRCVGPIFLLLGAWPTGPR